LPLEHIDESLKILRSNQEAVNRRRTDNTMAKRKRTKWQTLIYKTLHLFCPKSSFLTKPHC